MPFPREPLPDYPDGQQVYSYTTQGLGAGWDAYGAHGGYGGWGPGDFMGGGAVNVAAYPKAPEDARGQIILAANAWSYDPEVGIVLSQAIDDVMARLGPAAYELMMLDAVVAATVEIVVLGILGDRQEFVPRVVAEPGERLDDAAEGDRAADIKLAKQLADEVNRMVLRASNRARRPFRETLRMTVREKLVNGASLAEIEKEKVADGPDAGKIMITAVQPKPHMTWAFVVDPYLMKRGIWAWTAAGPRVVGLEKFLIQSWAATSSDPRGTSILRPAYDPWNFKQAAKPFRAKHMSLFSDPTLVIKYDASSPGRPQYQLDDHGNEDFSRPPLTAVQMARQIAANFHSGSYAVVPKEWEIEPIETRGDGSAFDTADAAYNREIVQSILLAARATQESEHNSKADNEGATDYAKMRLDYGRRSTCDDVEAGLAYVYVLDNYGKDVADRLTPRLSLGQPHKGDVASLMTAATGAGYKLGPRQLPALDAEFGLPVRTADEVDKMQSDMDAATRASSPDGPGQGTGPVPPGSGGGKAADEGGDDGKK